MVQRLEVLVVVKLAVPLQQTEALRGAIRKATHSKPRRVIERPPEPFSAPGGKQEPIGVVDFRTEVIERPRPGLPVQKHAR
jgi:hypothetical protein